MSKFMANVTFHTKMFYKNILMQCLPFTLRNSPVKLSLDSKIILQIQDKYTVVIVILNILLTRKNEQGTIKYKDLPVGYSVVLLRNYR